MKILSIIYGPPQNDAHCTRISNIVRLLEKNGMDIDLMYYVAKGFENYKIFKIGIFNGNFLVHDPLTLLFRHLTILTNENYDLVYGNTALATFFCVLGKLMNKPLILDMHGISEENSYSGKPKIICLFIKIMERVALLFSDKVFCVSHKMIDYLHNEKNIDRDKLFYVPNGVDLDFFNQADENQINDMKIKYKIQDKLIFGYLGGNQKWQGLENFIAASKDINEDKFASIIVGCDISQWLQKDNIIYIPRVSKEEIIKYYSLCDVLVLPRPKNIVTEVAAPTKFAEYVSIGKPVLITNVGDAARLVKKYDNGLIIENNNLINLKKGIKQFLVIDKSKMKEMGENSRKLAENEFDWNKISNDLIRFLKI